MKMDANSFAQEYGSERLREECDGADWRADLEQSQTKRRDD